MKPVSFANLHTPPRPNRALCSLLHFTAKYLGCTNNSISWYTVLIRFCLLSLCGKLVLPLLSSLFLFFLIQMVVTRKGIIHRNLETVNSLTSEQCPGWWWAFIIAWKVAWKSSWSDTEQSLSDSQASWKWFFVQWWEKAAKTETARDTQEGGRRWAISLLGPSLRSSG